MLSRKLHLEGVGQLSVPDTPGLWLPSWHTGAFLVPKHLLIRNPSILLPLASPGTRGVTSSIPLA